VIAGELGHHPALGRPVLGPFYYPWMWIIWSFHHYPGYGALFTRAYLSAAVVLVGAFGVYALMLTLTRRSQGHAHLHGSAHFASPEEIRRTGLLPRRGEPGRGVYVGGWRDRRRAVHYLRHDGPEHVLAVAPTRSGKGVGLVIPTLLSWPHSAVVLDIKGENWALSAGWRKTHAGNRVLKFDPTASDGSSVRFNPLEEVRLSPDEEVADAQNIATMIVDPDGKGLNDHWQRTAHALLVGALLHVLYLARARGTVATLREVVDLLSDPARPIEAVLEEMRTAPHREGQPHPVVAAAARDMLNRADRERSGVLSTAVGYLTLYRDPLVARNTERSEFRIRDLMHHETPVSLYLVLRPSDKDRLRPLIRLVITQIVRRLTERLEFRDGENVAHYRHRLLLMLDEFPSLGRLDVFQESLAYFGGYGLKAYLVVQDLAQLHGAYGREESILSNCHLRVAYAPNKVETAEWLSKMTGTATVIKRQVSVSGKRLGTVLGQASESYQEVQRPLLTPDECMRLPGPRKDAEGRILDPGDMLIFAAGHAPIYGTQILYFRDPVFSARARLPAPRHSDRLRIPPFDTSGEASGDSVPPDALSLLFG
jgi:type IV secretion system protein VirD4